MTVRGRPIFGIGLVLATLLSTYGVDVPPVTLATPLPGQTPFVMRVTDLSEYTDSGLAVQVRFVSPDPGNPSGTGYLQSFARPRAEAPDFASLVGYDYSERLQVGGQPTSVVYGARIHGRRHAIPFRSRFGVSREIEATGATTGHVAGYPVPHVRMWYRYQNGRFVAYQSAADPRCDSAVLSGLAKKPISGLKAACAYGWALAVGRYAGRTVVADYRRHGGSWKWNFMMPLHPKLQPYYEGSEPGWLRSLLLKRISGT